jgi:hypothetical protein
MAMMMTIFAIDAVFSLAEELSLCIQGVPNVIMG